MAQTLTSALWRLRQEDCHKFEGHIERHCLKKAQQGGYRDSAGKSVCFSSKDLNSAPRTHVWQFAILLTSGLSDPIPFSGFLGTCTYEHINENKEKLLK